VGARTLICILITTAVLGGCEKPEPPRPCLDPPVTTDGPAGGWAVERDRTRNCIRLAAYDNTRRGGPVATAAGAAVAACAAREDAALAAMKETGPVYPYQRKLFHDDLAHLAKLSAIQARAQGCGVPAGAPRDQIDTP
jgi:hypothetical protein